MVLQAHFTDKKAGIGRCLSLAAARVPSTQGEVISTFHSYIETHHPVATPAYTLHALTLLELKVSPHP